MHPILSSSFLHLRVLWGSLVTCLFLGATLPVMAQDHAHHQMTDEQFAELRQKVPLYREFTDEQIIENMSRMGPNFHVYLSDIEISGKIGVLALGHGYEPSGNEAFKNAYEQTAQQYPTAVGFGMAMMSSDHIQSAVDELTSAGVDTVLVIPVTTLKAGGLIGQWRYIFDLQENAPWMSVDRVQSNARIVFGPTPTTDPLISAILLDYADELSRDPSNEVVALVAHGPDDAEANAGELIILEQHAAVIRNGAAFAEVRGFTLQDDAPSAIRQANINRIRGWVQMALDRDQRVIVLTTLPVKGSVQKKIRRDLEGLDYDLSEKGIVENPRFSEWIDAVIASATEK
jgi:sirohydrochlorin ferrochelatase